MYARAVTIQLHPEKIAEAGQIMEEVAERLQGVDGFHEITLLADETTGHGHLISLWESEEAIKATAPTIFKGAMERLTPLSQPRHGPNSSKWLCTAIVASDLSGVWGGGIPTLYSLIRAGGARQHRPPGCRIIRR